MTYSAATPVVSSIPFAPPLNVTLVEPSHKRRSEDSSEDHLEMLAAFEEVWVARK